MKVGTVISSGLIMISVAIFFFVIDPMFASNRIAAFLIYMVLFFGLMFVIQKLEDRFEFFQKKMDGQLAVILIIVILALPFFWSMV
ncbi:MULTISPECIES: hypothetical protein [Planomicrobium]|uniref:hypothetical protein n=1 Tax=Planomicrobium TaxID=162291 RepID=UPI000A06E2A8|nr:MULTISPECIES: hypothetical protein [Planomicrobium]PKH11189.1 hypothetical protein CXF70_05775 [Planomicrobium sp. MB-3u-38]